MVNNSSINSSAKHSVSAQAPKRHCAVAKNSQPESSLHNLEGLNSQTASIISPDPQNLTAPVKDLRLRSYQERIVKEGVKHNTLIVLPTGSGKTLIAAEAIRRVGTPAIFFVPTVLLVEQQKKALESWTGLDVHPYAGGMYLPPHFDILVSTPKAFEDAQVNLGLDYLQWNRLKCVVFDEVHHALKDHPYRKLALSLRDSCVSVRVLGLTASYTYAVGEKKIKTALQRLCDELQITNLQTAAEEELRSAGYHASSAKPESPPPTDLYEIPPGVVQPSLRRPHLMLTTFLKRVEVGQATQLSSILTKTVLQMEMAAAAKDPSFLSPVQRGKGVKQWGVYAHACAAQARDTYHFGMYSQLESWYEALRLMVVSWEEADFAAITFLRMCGCDSIDGKVIWPPPVADCIRSFWSASPTSFGRLNRLRSVLLEKVETLDQFRGLIFVQQRVTTHILEYYISKDPELSRLFSTACLYASSKPATPSLNVTKAQTAAKLRSFATGAVNLLITTVVAEEGT